MKKFIYIIFIIILSLPVIQMFSGLFPIGKLNGVIYPSNNISFSIERWFSNDYQKQKESYIKDHLGFRTHFIKAQNQLLYSLYNKANNPGGVVGKEDYLFLDSYIFNHTGENFIGDDKILGITKKLKYLQDYFAKKNITLLTAFLPSKASFYPEYIPDRFKNFNQSNYSEFIKSYDNLDLNYIDLIPYFNNLKGKTDYPLFPKNGLHWTSYGMALGMDTIIKKIESIRNIDIQNLNWEVPVKMKKNLNTPDYDAEDLMNLLVKLERDSMPYPQYIFSKDTLLAKPKTLAISDSYYWQVYQSYIPHNIFDWGGFWYYFNTLRYSNNNIEQVYSSDSIPIKEKLLDQEVIILFASQATLHLFPFNFEEKAYHFFMPQDSISLTYYFEEKLTSDTSMINSLIRKADQNGYSYANQLKEDIETLRINYLDIDCSKDKQIKKLIIQIRSDKNWFEQIKEKSKKQNKTIEEMLFIDAEWIYKNSKKEN